LIQFEHMCRFKVIAKPLAQFQIPAFGGSMIRGALGHALRHCQCRCYSDSPVHGSDCLYASLFEPGAGHAFVLTPPPEGLVAAGQAFEFAVTLLKNDAKHVEALLSALKLALRRGLGPNMVPCSIVAVQNVTPEITPLGQRVQLQLTSPWFIKYRGKALLAHQLTLHSFLIAVAQRQRMLIKEGFLQATIPGNQPLLALADTLESRLQLSDVRGERRSNRQHSKHPLNGISGTIEITSAQPEGLQKLAAMLYRAQWLHGGGKTSFGLGGLKIQPAL